MFYNFFYLCYYIKEINCGDYNEKICFYNFIYMFTIHLYTWWM